MKKTTDAAAVLRFISGLTTPKGWNAGRPFHVLPWQRRFISRVVAGRFRVYLASMGRGAGKSGLGAALGAAIVGGPLAVDNVENVVVAPTTTQAGHIFNSTCRLLGIGPRGDPGGRFSAIQSGQNREVKNLNNGCVLRIAASDSKTLMGEGFRYAILDEIGFWRNPDAAYSALETSLGKIEGAAIIALGTRPLIAEGTTNVFNRMIDTPTADTDVTLYHYRGENPLTMAAAHRANPSLKYFPALRKEVRAELKAAKIDADREAAFKALRLNDGSAYDLALIDAALITLDDWETCVERTPDTLPAADGPFVLGLDPGGSASWTAAACYFPQTGRLVARCYMPELPTVEARARRDHIEIALYRRLLNNGELTRVPGRVVNLGEVIGRAVETYGRPAAIITDRYREPEVAQAVADAKIRAPLVTRGTGFADADVDTRAFQAACLDGKVAVAASPLMRFGIGETILKLDTSGAQKIDRARRYGKTDMYAASVLAVSHARRNPLRAGKRHIRAYIGGQRV